MKTNLFHRIGIAITLCVSTLAIAQSTAGQLTFDFTPNVQSPCYTASNHVLAVWIQKNDVTGNGKGTFVKSKLVYGGNGDTKDHLRVYAVNAGGTASNFTLSNKTDATTGATLKSFTAKSITWDGKGVNGALNGTTVPDGSYKVTIEQTWGHNATTQTIVRSFVFTKGPNPDTQTPTDTYFSNISLKWKATPLSVDENVAPNTQVVVYPNPTSGTLNIEFKNEINNIKILNMLGQVVYEKTDVSNPGTTKSIDLSSNGSGMYLVNVSNDKGTSSYKVMLEK